MGLLSGLINTAGIVLLTHAVYSSYEHSLTHAAPASSTQSLNTLPADIIIETLLSTTLLCIGIVLGAPALRPIQWRVWANEASQDDRRPPGKRAFENQEDGGMVGNPFRFLEDGERRGFVDVVGRRREFAKWVKEGSQTDVRVGS